MTQDQARWTHLEGAQLTMEALTVAEVTEMVAEVGTTDLAEQTSLQDPCSGLRSRMHRCVEVDSRKISNFSKVYSIRSIKTARKRVAIRWASWWGHQAADQAGLISQAQVEVLAPTQVVQVDLYCLVLEMR